jgi:hypothetical protein
MDEWILGKGRETEWRVGQLFWRILDSFWEERAERASDKDNKQTSKKILFTEILLPSLLRDNFWSFTLNIKTLYLINLKANPKKEIKNNTTHHAIFYPSNPLYIPDYSPAATIPNNAAAPTIPTTPLWAAAFAPAVLVLALGAVVVATIPLVKGTLVAEETPAKATAWVVAVGIGVAVWLEGLSTLYSIYISISWLKSS